MPLSELKTGMRFVGKTCFAGTEIEEFQGEIIGIEPGAFAGGSLIWAILEGPRLAAHGVLAGMSGSPCYVDGRLIGAVAYGFGSSQTPIAGITPIESMWGVMDLTNDKPHAEEQIAGSGSTAGVWHIEELRARALEARPPMAVAAEIPVSRLPGQLQTEVPAGALSVQLQPLALPIGISSCPPQVYQPLADFLAGRNMRLVTGGMGSSTPDAASLPPLEEGSAVGMSFMTGDLTVGGYGTATYRQGDRLIAFGHPAFGWGDVDIPLSPCVMFAAIPSYASSSKLGQVATPIGAFRQDREPGVGGVIGPVPRMFPMRVRVTAPELAQPREFQYRIWDNQYFASALAMTGLSAALSATVRSDGDATTQFDMTIHVKDNPPIRKQLHYASTYGPIEQAASTLMSDLSLLKLNPFEQGKIESVECEVSVSPVLKVASMVALSANKKVYRPGETVRLAATLQPFRGNRETRRIEIALPDDLADGEYTVFVGDGSARLREEQSRAPGLFTPLNFRQLLQAMSRHYAGNTLYVMLGRSDAGLTVYGQELPSLPSSMRDLMASSGEGAFIDFAIGRPIAEKVIESDAQLSGSARLSLTVSRVGQR